MPERAQDRNKDLYDLLEVSPTASQGVIRAAYYALARAWHPDRNPAPEAAQRIRDINDAYRVLSDPSQRANYDLQRARANRRERLLTTEVIQVHAAPHTQRRFVVAGSAAAPHPPRRVMPAEHLMATPAGRFSLLGGQTMLVLIGIAIIVALLLVLFSITLGMGDDAPIDKAPPIGLVTR